MTRRSRPVQGVLTFLDPLFGCASLVIELHHIAGFPPKIRDYEVDSWKKLSRMPFDLGDYSASNLPTGCLIPEAMVQDNRLLRWTPDGTRQQMLDLAVQNLIAL